MKTAESNPGAGEKNDRPTITSRNPSPFPDSITPSEFVTVIGAGSRVYATHRGARLIVVPFSVQRELTSGMEIEDAELVRSYVKTGSEDAFAELVSRYIDMVYATASRQARNAQLA